MVIRCEDNVLVQGYPQAAPVFSAHPLKALEEVGSWRHIVNMNEIKSLSKSNVSFHLFLKSISHRSDKAYLGL